MLSIKITQANKHSSTQEPQTDSPTPKRLPSPMPPSGAGYTHRPKVGAEVNRRDSRGGSNFHGGLVRRARLLVRGFQCHALEPNDLADEPAVEMGHRVIGSATARRPARRHRDASGTQVLVVAARYRESPVQGRTMWDDG